MAHRREQKEQKVIAQLLERQREANVLLNNYQQKMLTVNELPERPQGKTQAEIRRENIILFVCLVIFIGLMGLVIWFSWHPMG